MKNSTLNTEVKDELFNQMLQQGPFALYAGEFVATIVFFGLYGHASFIPLSIWYASITFITIVRLVPIKLMKNKLAHHYSVKLVNHYAVFYTAGALIAGLCWGCLVCLYGHDQVATVQLFILVIVIGMPMAGLSTNAILPSVFYAFTIPLLTSLIIWSLFLTPEIEVKFILTALVYSILVISTGKRFHRNLYISIQRGFENQHLVEELRKGNAQLQELAYRDHLTDLPNRRQFQLNAERTLARVRRNNSSMAIMLIDVDNFKQINDTYGHEAGDELLMELSQRIKDSIRQSDVVTRSDTTAARLGGDEFIVLLENEHEDIDVEPAARRILKNIRTTILLNEINLTPSVSIGVALAPKHTDDLRTLMSYADKAMYETKQSGGNGYTVFGEEENDLTTMIMEAEIA